MFRCASECMCIVDGSFLEKEKQKEKETKQQSINTNRASLEQVSPLLVISSVLLEIH